MSYAMSDLLHLMVSEGGSDLHIRVGVPPAMRLHGILQKVEGPALTNETSEELMRSITSEGPEVNRPPHCALAGLRVSFGLMA